jgi:Glycosyl transferase family 2
MVDTLLQRLMALLRSVRRGTVLGPLLDAWAIRSVLASIEGDLGTLRVLGPSQFSPYVRCLTVLDASIGDVPVVGFDWVIVVQGRLASLPLPLLRGLRDEYFCTIANRSYLLFRAEPTSPGRAGPSECLARDRINSILEGAPASEAPPLRAFRWRDRAILVTTFERPAALERSLPQIVALQAPVLVIDDGSAEDAAERNRALARMHGVGYVRLPSNRGISAALNIGLEYLLADERLTWISYLQDDVDVHPDALERLSRVEDAELRPILTGYDADEHPTLEDTTIGGFAVRLKRETAGVHLHAHRNYWRGVLPIPTEYLGAPKRRWGASLEDSWITVGAPSSAGQAGIPVVCLPGLIRTFLWHPGDSTWGNPNEPEPPLEPDSSEGQS